MTPAERAQAVVERLGDADLGHEEPEAYRARVQRLLERAIQAAMDDERAIHDDARFELRKKIRAQIERLREATEFAYIEVFGDYVALHAAPMAHAEREIEAVADALERLVR